MVNAITNIAKPIKISACMIVRDEEKMLPDCLKSLAGWVDEIIIVDTGSVDGTLGIIREGMLRNPEKIKLREQVWRDDFSYHRNYSMSEATRDWIFIIDADERVAPGCGPEIKSMIHNVTEDVILAEVLNVYGEKQEVRGRGMGMRFFRRSAKIKYENKVHNAPVLQPEHKVARVGFRMFHLGYGMDEAAMTKKLGRVVRMCRKLVEDSPDDIASYYHLIRALRTVPGKDKFNFDAADEMKELVKKALRIGNGHDDANRTYLQCLGLAAWNCYALEEHEDAVVHGMKALALKPDYLDALLVVGLSSTFGLSADEGEKYLLRYLREQEVYGLGRQVDNISMEHANSRSLAYRALADLEDWRLTMGVMANSKK